MKLALLKLASSLGLTSSLSPVLFACATGCGSHQTTKAPAVKAVPKQEDTAPKRVSNRPANLMGRVYVAEYHHIRAGRGPMFRTPKQFRADLNLYYKMGFRPVLASEYLANKMPLAPGASPVVMTFDDSNPSQIQLTKTGEVDPRSAVGIWMEFAKTHPDFPVHGTFFVLPGSLWGKKKQAKEKVKLLLSMGSELANLTMSHPFLNHCSDAKVKYEVATCNFRLDALGQPGPHTLAVPYGEFPRHSSILKGFTYKGKQVEFSGVFMAWGGPARSPNDPKLNRYKIPRMMAVNEEDSIENYIKTIKKGHYKPYVQP